MSHVVTVAYGDGVGPEVMEAVLEILKEAEARIRIETIEISEKLYAKYYTYGVTNDTLESVNRIKVLLTSPVIIPPGCKSFTEMMSKELELHIDVFSINSCKNPSLNIFLVAKNSINAQEEEHSAEVIQCGFKYARHSGRNQVTCLSRDQMFHETFNQISKEYPNIQKNCWTTNITNLIDEKLGVVVTSSMYSDILGILDKFKLTNVTGYGNIGKSCAIFRPIHEALPDIADQNIANPSGALSSAIMMLDYIGQGEVARTIERAWKKTLLDGVHTFDIYDEKTSSSKATTLEFIREIIKRL